MTIPEAIEFLKCCMVTHSKWIEFYDKHPYDEEKYKDIAGDKQHHIDVNKKYEQVVTILELMQTGM